MEEQKQQQNNTTMLNTLEHILKTEGISAMRSILHTIERTNLQDICVRNDRNGVWSDEDNIAEFGCVMPDKAYREIIERWLIEDL